MEFKLTKPCSNCPFLKIPYFYLDKERKKEIAESLLNQDKTFACHKTTNGEWNDEYTEYIEGGGEQHCAGALIFLNKLYRLYDNFSLRLAVMAKIFDPNKLDMKANVFKSLKEFINATDPNGNS